MRERQRGQDTRSYRASEQRPKVREEGDGAEGETIVIYRQDGRGS